MNLAKSIICSFDGDGCGKQKQAEEILAVIEDYPHLKFNIGVLVGLLFKQKLRTTDYEIKLKAAGRKEGCIRAIKKILALKNVEIGNHSWTHPFRWRKELINLNLEIVKSTNFINKRLAPKGKVCKVFALSGFCDPMEEALKAIYDAGLIPFNGRFGPTIPYKQVGKYKQYYQRAPHELHWCGMRTKEGRPNPVGYKGAIEWYKERGDRPVHIYCHFYSGESVQMLDSLRFVLDEVSKWSLTPIFITEYVKHLERRK